MWGQLRLVTVQDGGDWSSGVSAETIFKEGGRTGGNKKRLHETFYSDASHDAAVTGSEGHWPDLTPS